MKISQLKHLTPISRMGSLFFYLQIYRDIRKFAQISVYWKIIKLFKCLISCRLFFIYKEGKPHFGKLVRLSISFWCPVYHLSIISNQRRYSSLLSIPMFFFAVWGNSAPKRLFYIFFLVISSVLYVTVYSLLCGESSSNVKKHWLELTYFSSNIKEFYFRAN